MDKYQFLSREWIDKVRELRQAYVDEHGKPAADFEIRMNQVVTDIPFGDGELKTYIDTTNGFLDMELGELPDAEVTVRIDYETAKSIFVNLDVQAAMTAFMSGRIRITGDFTKLMSLQGAVSPEGLNPDEVAKRIQEITS
ncbi:MAG: SCP2 sterol-binding domain-containing protein [Nitrospiraceae bacterium]|nr:SCP2 sterol-binding domain-containing protein [Nitrospiraceae bacterium]MDA8261821.1 SCP2 sterol-binding domain-containing protein [Actinomycetota bacterium]